MRRLEPRDKALLAIFLPAWLLSVTFCARSALIGAGFSPLFVAAAPSPSELPTVTGFVPYWNGRDSGLEVGDRLVRVGDADLQGVGRLAFFAEVQAQARRDQEAVSIVFDRGGRRAETAMPVGRVGIYWVLLAGSLGSALVAVFLLFRARPSLLVRASYLAFITSAVLFASVFGGGRWEAYASVATTTVFASLSGFFILRLAWLFPDGVSPTSPSAWYSPYAFLVFGPMVTSAFYGFPLPSRLGFPAYVAVVVAFLAAHLAIATLKYRRASHIGRRRLKWVMFGLYCASLPPAVTAVLAAMDPRFTTVYLGSFATFALVPVAIFMSVQRYNLFDIDRVISTAASYNLLLVILIGGALVIVPRVAEAASAFMEIDPAAGQIVLSLLLATCVVPAHRRLRPRIERAFFAERYAVDQGIAGLLGELSACADAQVLMERVGETLQRVMRPEGTVVYARVGDAYIPVFVEERAVPPAFDAGGPLVATLRARGAPLTVELGMAPFDGAALETLGAAVVVPVQRGAGLLSFLCLGRKRSGDVYTPTDLALLAAVGEKMSAELNRFDDEEIIRHGRAMQAALSRYVPRAIAERVATGASSDLGECEVTVLFVDIRGYTAYAETRRSAEIFSTVAAYTEAVSEVVHRHGGHVVDFSGDGMMAIFGVPHELPSKERAALDAGREIFVTVAGLVPAGDAPRLAVGVGIATGHAFVGNLPAADRTVWTAIGDTVNLAARLQALSRELGAALVMDGVSWQGLGGIEPGFERRSDVAIRGRQQREDLYVLPLPEDGTAA